MLEVHETGKAQLEDAGARVALCTVPMWSMLLRRAPTWPSAWRAGWRVPSAKTA
jgi:hypothetical protein